MKLYFDIGIAKNNDIMSKTKTLEPRFVEINPRSGSVGGTLITANVQGVGPGTTGLDIVDMEGNSIC